MEKILDLGGVVARFGNTVGESVRGGHRYSAEPGSRSLSKIRWPGWHYLCGRGEQIPLGDESVDGVFWEVALPYMHIPRTLAELKRVLVPGGWLRATLHYPSFTYRELVAAFPKPKPNLFRTFVLPELCADSDLV